MCVYASRSTESSIQAQDAPLLSLLSSPGAPQAREFTSMGIKPQMPFQPQHSPHANKMRAGSNKLEVSNVITNSWDQSQDAGRGAWTVGVGGGGGGGAGGAALGEMEVCMRVHFQVVVCLVLLLCVWCYCCIYFLLYSVSLIFYCVEIMQCARTHSHTHTHTNTHTHAHTQNTHARTHTRTRTLTYS